MNLEESDKFIEENEKKKKKKVLLIALIVLCVVAIIGLFVLIGYVKYLDSQTLKVFLDDKQVKNNSADLFKNIGNETYVNIKEIANILGYDYTKGDYGKYNENNESCYLTSTHEEVAFKNGSTNMEKYIIKTEEKQKSQRIEKEKIDLNGIVLATISSDKTQELYTLKSPIKYVSSNLYMPFSALPEAFNIQVDTKNEKRIRLYSFAYLYNYAAKVAAKNGYSITGEFENAKAVVNGYAVVAKESKFGVISFKGDVVVSLQYSAIKYLQNVNEFIVYADGSIGLMNAKGNTIIKPEEKYESISVYNTENQLYLVKKDGKFGILNNKGETVIYPDYAQIGLKGVNGTYANGEFDSEIDDYNILFNRYIPIRNENKYGLYDLEKGEFVTKNTLCPWDVLGCTRDKEASSGEKGVLVIPKEAGISGIVIGQNGLYGVYDAKAGRIALPISCSRIYSITKNGETKYYMELLGSDAVEISTYLSNN